MPGHNNLQSFSPQKCTSSPTDEGKKYELISFPSGGDFFLSFLVIFLFCWALAKVSFPKIEDVFFPVAN